MKTHLIAMALFLVGWSGLFAQAQDIPALLTEIKHVVQAEAKSPERALDHVQFISHKALQGKFWCEVEPQFNKAGLKAISEREGGFSAVRCVVVPGAITAAGGVKFDLFWELQVSEGRSQPSYEVPPNNDIYNVNAGLSVTLLQPVKEVQATQPFGKALLIQAALADWPIAQATAEYPVLERVELKFVRGRVNTFDGGVPDRLHVELSFVRSKEDRATRRTLSCYADLPADRTKPLGEIEGWAQHDESGPGAAKSLAADLTKLLKDKSLDYQLLLHKGTHIVDRAAAHREWPVVAKEVEGQGLTLLSEDSWQYGMNRDFLVTKDAVTTSAGLKMDLRLHFSTSRHTSKTQATREVIFEAYPYLYAEPRVTVEAALSNALFGKDTAAHRALEFEKVMEAAKNCPFLESIEIYYDLIALHRQAEQSWGFVVRPYLIRGKGDDSKYESTHVYQFSELDLPTGYGGTLLAKDFVPKNILHKPFMLGSSSGSRGGQPGEVTHTFTLTKKGTPRWPPAVEQRVKHTVAYGVGDLKTLPATTVAIDIDGKEIYDDDLELLTRFKDLQALDMISCEGVSDAGLARLAGLKKLESLEVSGKRFSGQCLTHFPNLRKLRVYSASLLTGDGIDALAGLKNLRTLDLDWSETGLADRDFAKLANLTELRELNLWGCKSLTDAGLAQIANLSKLEKLKISSSKHITAEGLKHLQQLTNLKVLSLGYYPLQDDGLQALSNIGTLEYVDVHGTDISGTGVQHLSKLTRLKRLYLYDCKQVKEQDVLELKRRLGSEYELE